MKRTSDSSAPWGQVAQVVQQQEIKGVQLAQLLGQGQVPLGCQQVLDQPVGWGEEDRAARLHQPMGQSAPGVGLAGAWEAEGQDVDAPFHELAPGQLVQLLAQGKGKPAVLEGFPGLARGEPGFLPKPVVAPLSAVLGLLLQHFQEGGQGVAMTGGGKTTDRLGAHGRQSELVTQLSDPFLNLHGVHRIIHHLTTSAVSRLPVSSRS